MGKHVEDLRKRVIRSKKPLEKMLKLLPIIVESLEHIKNFENCVSKMPPKGIGKQKSVHPQKQPLLHPINQADSKNMTDAEKEYDQIDSHIFTIIKKFKENYDAIAITNTDIRRLDNELRLAERIATSNEANIINLRR